MASATPYPWALLEPVSRASARAGRAVREAAGRAPTIAEVEAAVSASLRTRVSVIVERVTIDAFPSEGARVDLVVGDGALRMAVALEPDLASAAIYQAMERPARLSDSSAPFGPPLQGALSAIVVDVIRRIGAAPPVRLAPPSDGEPGLVVRATVVFHDRTYGLRLWAHDERRAAADENPMASLRALGDAPLTLGVIAAQSLGDRREVASLSRGDAWLPGEGWIGAPSLSDGVFSGSVALAGAQSEVGVSAECSPDGRIVLTGDRVPLVADRKTGEEPMDDETNTTLAEVALDTPMVLRVEVASVTLPARDVAALRPGDVIETGQRINAPVVLRSGGQSIARGELVNVDGEIGVRIRDIAGRGGDP